MLQLDGPVDTRPPGNWVDWSNVSKRKQQLGIIHQIWNLIFITRPINALASWYAASHTHTYTARMRARDALHVCICTYIVTTVEPVTFRPELSGLYIHVVVIVLGQPAYS